ncbi:MAG: glycosyltransferase [Bacteroides sp.]|uniref:glycosyltransferase family 32 protein n=1 Tax=Bacteroides sp. TaxID=29523 RepID=UPI0026DFDA3D|nr:glycosyltransferase [Bacteroides sp.]MDO5420226.1 glycosyltransferase [Bacteroides sp.]
MIPKTIHYCWFNDTPIPYSLQVCMDSWKKNLPDYKWKLWSLKDFDVNSLPWTKEAFHAGALAFVADYVRLHALYTEGGIYMDTDVMVKKSFDPLLSNGFFTAIEYHPEMIEGDEMAGQRLEPDGTNRFPGVRVPGLGLLSAILGAEKGHPYLVEAMKFYEGHHFIQEDGSWYTKEIAPDVLALAAEKFGLKYDNEIEQQLEERMLILPSRILGAAWKQVTDDTIAVHLSKGSWRKRTWLRNILTKLNFYRKIFRAHK